MSARVDPPQTRHCEQCGRRETWDETDRVWRVDADRVGDVHCIHEWDITGTYRPVSE